MKKLKLIVILLITLQTNQTFASNITSEDQPIHYNFKEYVDWLKRGNTLQVEVTRVNPATAVGTHYFTAWGAGRVRLSGNKLRTKLKILFSDRKRFTGNKDIVSYNFNTYTNSVEVTLNSWGNGKTTLKNLIKQKNTIYHIDNKGSMTIFNFKKIKSNFSSRNTISSKIITVTPKVLMDLCPHAQVGGDYDFGGNGPRIKGKVELLLSNDKRKIQAVIKFNAKETKSDWSEVKGTWIKTIYKAPYGQKIKAIRSASNSKFNKVLIGGGRNEMFGGGSDGSKHTLFNRDGFLSGDLVKKMVVVGDTGGWDISTDDNCSNDTRIELIEFNQIKIELEY